MKNKNSFIFKGLISLMLSLVMICGTAVTSLSAVTDQVVAAVKEPVRSAIPDAPAPAQATDETDIATQSAPIAPDYGVAEGSLLAEPADDDVLDIAFDSDTPAEDSSASLTLSREKNTEFVTTGAAVTGQLDTSKIYYLGADSDTYRLVYESGWKVKRTSDSYYYNVTYSNYSTIGSWESSGTTTYTASTANASGVILSCSVTERSGSVTYYLSYSNGNFSQSSWGSNNRIAVYEATVTFMVTFDKNDGSGTTTTQNNIPANTATALTANAFTREGYTFTGWNTAADGSGTSYDDKASVTLSASITLYAQWQQDAPPASANTLYFTNVSGWNYLKAYLYNDTTGAKNAAFPGTTMTDLQQDDGYGHGIYSIEADPSVYEYVIFSNTDTSGGNTTAHAQTVSIKIEDALANGAGIYCVPSGSGYETDSQEHLQVNCYTYGDKSSTGDPDTITYTKQIEKKNPNNDNDYNYRLHLNVDGSSLSGSTTETTPGESSKKRAALVIDVSETMTSTSLEGSSSGKNKFEAVREILLSDDGFLKKFMNGTNEVSIILVWGVSGGGTQYTSLYATPTGTKVTEYNTVNASWNSTHQSTTLSYVTGLMAVDDIYGQEEVSVIFIAGNAPKTYVKLSDGYNEFGTMNADVYPKNLADYRTWMERHPNATFYGVGINGQQGTLEGGSETLQTMGEESGGYYSTDSVSDLINNLNNIIEKIIPADKTSNITITDSLSKYVDFASSPNLTATLYTGENFATATNVSSFVSISGDTVTFSRAAEIEGPFKLEIAFDIKTADGVLQNTDTYGSTGYPNKGDDGTDYSSASYNHNFSANKPGYYANSSATINYTLNGTAKSGTFIKPVVQAPEDTPVQGKYIFKYIDRYGDERTVEVPVTLNSSEKKGYSGNNNQPGVPTFLWTADAQNLFTNNPLVTAALRVDGNAELEDGEAQKDVSVYKHTIEWANLNTDTYTAGSNVSFNFEDHTVTVTANTPEMTFTFNYKIMKNGKVVNEAATQIPYGRAVTFHPQYSDTSKYVYINDTIPSEGFSYWSADEAGNIPITTNLTFGMLIRGDYMHDGDDETIVTVYAQYNKTPAKDWNPLIEEAKLTHTIEDMEGSKIDWLYLDYMTNYLSKDGSVVKDMIDAGNDKIRFGLIAVKHDGTKTPDQAKMINIAQAMITNNKQSAYLDSAKQTIAYRYEYGNPNDDVKPISNFNRVLYTLHTDTEKAENHTFSAIAYITVDGTNYFYSEVNSDIVVHDLIEN